MHKMYVTPWHAVHTPATTPNLHLTVHAVQTSVDYTMSHFHSKEFVILPKQQAALKGYSEMEIV